MREIGVCNFTTHLALQNEVGRGLYEAAEKVRRFVIIGVWQDKSEFVLPM